MSLALLGAGLALIGHTAPPPRHAYDLTPEELSCGPSALIAAVRAFDEHTAGRLLGEMASDPDSRRPVTSLHHLFTWSDAAGLGPAGVRLDASELSALPLPAVLHLEPNHFVALIELNEMHALVIDQGSAPQPMPRETLESRFSGHALCLTTLPRRAASPEG